MPEILCPHCREMTFTIGGWAHLDRCPACGKPLSRRDPRTVEAEIRARLYGGRERESGRTSGAA